MEGPSGQPAGPAGGSGWLADFPCSRGCGLARVAWRLLLPFGIGFALRAILVVVVADCEGLRTGKVDFATEPLPPHESYLLIATGAQDMADDPNRYETGARKYPAKTSPDAADEFSQDAAGNKPPPGGMGLTRPADDFDDRTLHSEGQNPPRAAIRPDGKATAKKPGKDARR